MGNENGKWVLSFLDVAELGQTERKLLTESRNQEDKRALSILRTRHRTRCCSQAIVGETRRKLNKLRDFLRVFFIFDASLGGWGGGRGASIRQGAFFLERASNTNYTPQGGRLLDTGRLFESGRLLDHLRYFYSKV